jgi:hypothetical protein
MAHHLQTTMNSDEEHGRLIADVLKTHHLKSGEDRDQTLLRYCLLYDEHPPQAALNGKTPMDAMRMWYASHPQCLNCPGCDIFYTDFKETVQAL